MDCQRHGHLDGHKAVDKPATFSRVPNEAFRAVLHTAGTVRLAIVTEAVVASGQVWVDKTVDVTADVVEHSYAPMAGQCVRDVTVSNLALVSVSIASASLHGMTVGVAKHTVKCHLQQQYPNATATTTQQ